MVLVSFVFTDETGVRQRPAVIISSDAYHRGREEDIIAAITSRMDRVLVGDHVIGGWRRTGLLFPSVATGIIRTIKQDMVARKLGAMPQVDMGIINGKLRMALDLGTAQAEVNPLKLNFSCSSDT